MWEIRVTLTEGATWGMRVGTMGNYGRFSAQIDGNEFLRLL